jgi:hypothetical protein
LKSRVRYPKEGWRGLLTQAWLYSEDLVKVSIRINLPFQAFSVISQLKPESPGVKSEGRPGKGSLGRRSFRIEVRLGDGIEVIYSKDSELVLIGQKGYLAERWG